MIKILKHGKSKELMTRRFICSKCACVFTATEDDFKHYFDRNEEYYGCMCPECNHMIYLPFGAANTHCKQ